MSDDYEVVMQSATVERLMACSRPVRQTLMDQLIRLAANPFTKGQRSVVDLSGREHQVMVAGPWEVTYWPDHAMKELRIVRLRKILRS
jgi:hypothetical protein